MSKKGHVTLDVQSIKLGLNGRFKPQTKRLKLVIPKESAKSKEVNKDG